MPKLKHLLILTLTATFAYPQAQKLPDSVEVITPIFHQLVAFNLPTRFNIAAPDQHNNDFYLHEFAPTNESVERWTQLITVNGYRGAVTRGQTAQHIVDTIAGHFKQNCPATFSAVNIGAMPVSGRPAYLIIAACGSVPDAGGQAGAVHAETALIIAIQGDQDLYTLQWAERTAANTGPPTIDQAKWKARLITLSPIHVCPLISGEQAPYPSCLGK